MARHKRALTFPEVQDRVLVAMSTQDPPLCRLAVIAKAADVKVKEAEEALKQLVKDGRINQWPAIKAYKINDRGLNDAAAIATRQSTSFQWTWNRRNG